MARDRGYKKKERKPFQKYNSYNKLNETKLVLDYIPSFIYLILIFISPDVTFSLKNPPNPQHSLKTDVTYE